MNAIETTADTVPVKDRKTGLIVFGILQLVLGGFCLLFLLLMGLGTLLPQPAGAEMQVRTLLPAVLVYLLLAVWFVWMGIGSIQGRRWARALILIASWVWLISGVTALAFLAMCWGAMAKLMNANGQMPAAVAAVMMAILFVVMVVIYMLIPGALVLFYGSRHVKATCERLDPAACWTDRCPLPVLAVSLMSGVAVVWLPVILGLYGWPVPCFGRIVHGMPGAGIVLGCAALLAFISRGAYRLDLRVWWCAVALAAAWGLSSAMTFARVGMMALYEGMPLPAAQLESMRQVVGVMDPWMAPVCVGWTIVILSYLLYIRRFFPRSFEPSP